MNKVDILLPIYNSYLETKDCIESILKVTTDGTYNLYLLDDNSPDGKILELISSYSEEYEFIFALRNDKNLGFPGNVNNGFNISSNDVVVLNSDTIVSEGWLDNLIEVANSEDTIAAINPMSNYGVISGLPTPNTEINELFCSQSLIEAFQKNRLTGYTETPLLIGYCIYIKRSALKIVGDFDAEAFKRGYGEETDWCMRARNHDFKLVVAHGSYVHHIGGISFGIEKEKLIAKSREILLKRYPEIDNEIKHFVFANHFKMVRKNMMKELNFLRTKTSLKIKLKMIKHYLTNR